MPTLPRLPMYSPPSWPSPRYLPAWYLLPTTYERLRPDKASQSASFHTLKASTVLGEEVLVKARGVHTELQNEKGSARWKSKGLDGNLRSDGPGYLNRSRGTVSALELYVE